MKPPAVLNPTVEPCLVPRWPRAVTLAAVLGSCGDDAAGSSEGTETETTATTRATETDAGTTDTTSDPATTATGSENTTDSGATATDSNGETDTAGPCGTPMPVETKIVASDGAAQDRFGIAVAADGGVFAVGSDRHDGHGVVYVFDDAGDELTQLVGSEVTADDLFGASIAVSGSRILAAAPSGLGDAYVFERINDVWSETVRLSPPQNTTELGVSLALAGTTAVAGASQSGARVAHVFAGVDFMHVGTVMAPTGQAGAEPWLSMSGDIVMAGGTTAGVGAGTVFVYEYSGSQLMKVDELSALDADSQDAFGAAVSVSGNRAVIGAPGDDAAAEGAGAAYVFERSGTRWLQVAKLMAADGAKDDRFGEAVAMDGDLVLVGAANDDDGGMSSGSAYLFQRADGTWPEVAKLTASDAQPQAMFGWSVALSDGVGIVGAWFDDAAGTDSGAAYLFRGLCGP